MVLCSSIIAGSGYLIRGRMQADPRVFRIVATPDAE